MIVQRKVYVGMTLPLPSNMFAYLGMTIDFEDDKVQQVPVGGPSYSQIPGPHFIQRHLPSFLHFAKVRLSSNSVYNGIHTPTCHLCNSQGSPRSL